MADDRDSEGRQSKGIFRVTMDGQTIPDGFLRAGGGKREHEVTVQMG